MLPPLLILPLLSQLEATAASDEAHTFALPTMPMALLLLESAVTPQLTASSLPLLLMFRSWPEAPSRQTQVGLLWPPLATAVAETVRVVFPGSRPRRKKVGM